MKSKSPMPLFNKEIRCPHCELKFFARTNYVDKTYEFKSSHQVAVEKFMLTGGQEVPSNPKIPSVDIRRLRAKLILEEALETIKALGFQIVSYTEGTYSFIDKYIPDLSEILDGCCDLRVVTTGTLSACGIKDIRPQEIVDQNNLDKFQWTENEIKYAYDAGHSINYKPDGSVVVRNKDGKILKPPSHQAPTKQLIKEITIQSSTTYVT